MKKDFLKVVAPFLWSYDLDAIDLEKDKRRIITNVLNLGTKSAVEWLFHEYEKSDIKEAIAKPLPGEWSDKSLNFWSIVLDVKSKETARKLS